MPGGWNGPLTSSFLVTAACASGAGRSSDLRDECLLGCHQADRNLSQEIKSEPWELNCSCLL